MKYRFLLVLLLCFCLPTWAAEEKTKQYTVHHYSVADGLPQNTVMAILQDQDGFIWLGTWDGLCRFDGYEFRSYKPSDFSQRIASNRVDYLYEDGLGYIWTRIYDGSFCRLNKHTNHILTTNTRDAHPSSQVRENQLLLEQRPGAIWLSGSKHLLCVLEEADAEKSDNVNTVDYNLHGEISFLLLDQEGTVWAGTDAGLEHVQEDSHCYLPGSTPDENKFTCGVATQGGLWLGTESGVLWHYVSQTDRFERVRLGVTSSITAIAALDDQLLLLTTSANGFVLYDRATHLVQRYSSATRSSITSNSFQKPYVDKQGNVWLVNEQIGVWRYRPSDRQLTHYTVPLDERYRDLLNYNFFAIEDQNGRLWLNPQGGGFSCYDPQTDRLTSPLAGCSNMVHSAYVDPEGSVWLGTYDLGLDRIDEVPDRFSLNDLRSDVLHSGEARAFYQLSSGELLVATKDRKIRRYSDAHQFMHLEPYHELVYAITEKTDGTILYGTKGAGILAVRGYAQHRLSHSEADPYSLSSDNVYDLLFTPDSTLCVATFGGGVNLGRDGRFLHKDNDWTAYPEQDGARVRQLYLLNDTLLLAACTSGLLRINLSSLAVESFPYYDIRAIVASSDGHLWLATFGGGLIEVLNPLMPDLLSSDNTHTFNSHNGLLSDIVIAIVPVKNGDLWFASEEMVSHYDVATHSFQHFNALERMPRTYFSEAKSLQLPNGQILFGFSYGACSFYPDQVFYSSQFPSLHFTDFLVSGISVEVGADSPLSDDICFAPDVHLDHNQNTFTFCFAALDYAASDNIRYAYRLDGLDDDWHYTSANARTATYTGVPHGDYVFRLRSTNAEGYWSTDEVTAKVYIKPSFWATPWAWMLYLLILVLAAWATWTNLQTGNRLRQEVAVEQKVTDIKLRFFTNVSHELRTPLTLISGPVENILRNEKISDDVRMQLEIVSSNASRMLRLVNQILDFRKIQNHKLRLVVQESNITAIAASTFRNFTKEASDKHIAFVFDPEMEQVTAWVDRDKVDTIIYNLLSNAFKFTPSGCSITLSVAAKPNYAIIRVSDTGIGIPKDKRSVLFERFSSHNEINNSPEKTGTGIGLNLVKELVDLHNGYIEVDSELGKGTTFTVMFHTGRNHFGQDVDIVFDDMASSEAEPVQGGEEETAVVVNPDKHTILVVDDNDDMRAFLQSIFAANYNVLAASDGKEALRMAAENTIELVVTDLMMPGVDGLQLTEQLKMDIRTSHLPVILLTAKSAIESRLQALRFGADDYITKPFSPDYLRARVENLLTQRARLQEIYRKSLLEPNEPPKEEEMSPNELFLNKIYQFMLANMDNNDLAVEDLVKETNLGRTVFFNKLKSLTGLSPIEYIRDVRIKRAAELLTDSRYNITEVTYMVGMNDSRYFAKVFKNAYGVTPTEFKRLHETGKEEKV